MDDMAKGALTGVKIVDLGRIVAGPLAAMLLGDMGADVIKVEPAPDGDFLRSSAPYFTTGMGSYFATVNRNKRSIIVDLRQAGGQKVLHRLLAEADVLVENFRPGVLEAMGLAPDWLRQNFPRLVVARVSAFGHHGPDAQRPGVDQIVQGLSGLMSVTGTPESGPVRAGIAVSDLFAGLSATIGILGALMARQQSGQGQIVETSLLEATLSLMSVQAGKYFATGVAPSSEGNHHPVIAPYGLFATADGFIQLQVMGDRHFRALAEVCAQPSWLDDPRFNSGAARSEHKDAIRTAVAEVLLSEPSHHWLDRLQAADIPCGSVLNLAEAYRSPQAQALNMSLSGTLGDGSNVTLPGMGFGLSDTPTGLFRPPPLPGEHTAEILTMLDLASDAQVRAAIPKEFLTEMETVA